MQLSAISLALTRAGIISEFTPKSLFTTGTQGVFYDVSDYANTCFEDSAGTTPITSPLEKPVGLMLDKSKGLTLGSELVTNGDFSNGTTGWTLGSGWSVSGGKLIATSVAFAVEAKQAIATLVAGSRYVVSFDVVVTSGTLKVNLSDLGVSTTELSISASGTYTYRPLQAGTAQITFWAASTFTGTIDNISVRELPGNHATQSTTTSRPTLSARYNLLTKTEQFDDAAWTKNGTASVMSNSMIAPNGTQTADTINLPNATRDYVYYPITVQAISYKAGVYLKGTAGETAYVYLGDGIPSGQSPLLTFTFNGEWQRLSADKVLAAGTQYFYFYRKHQNGGADATATSFYAWGADLRVANDGVGLPAYQRVNTDTDYDYAGFPPYLKFDGTDDGMATNSIDFSATDKMFVAAGVRKLSDAASGMSVELSAISDSNAGSFYLFAPGSSGADSYRFGSRGSSAWGSNLDAARATGYAAPETTVLAGQGSISGDTQILRRNGAQVAANTTFDQGTGNFGNYPLYIGRRGGLSLPFNGRIYSLVIVGKTASASEITSTENWVNSKTKAY